MSVTGQLVIPISFKTYAYSLVECRDLLLSRLHLFLVEEGLKLGLLLHIYHVLQLACHLLKPLPQILVLLPEVDRIAGQRKLRAFLLGRKSFAATSELHLLEQFALLGRRPETLRGFQLHLVRVDGNGRGAGGLVAEMPGHVDQFLMDLVVADTTVAAAVGESQGLVADHGLLDRHEVVVLFGDSQHFLWRVFWQNYKAVQHTIRTQTMMIQSQLAVIFKIMSEPHQGTKSLSLSEKRDLMWNIIEPGDPYDIRKSMIAKLPGQRKPMGPHLELVCLLQAAEIERLCQCLQENRMKLRESERIDLDRHSYEVQIKQLSEKASQEDALRSEVDKLKQFIHRQSIQLQQIERRQIHTELQAKYDESLKQVESILAQNNSLKAELRQYQSQVHQQQSSDLRKSTQLQQLQAAHRALAQQLERERQQQIAPALQQYQHRYNMLLEEIDRLNGVLRDKSKEAEGQRNTNRQLVDDLRHKEDLLNENGNKIKHMEQTISHFQKQQRESLESLSGIEQKNALIDHYETSLQKFSLEVDRLNNVLHKKVNQLEESKRRNNELQGRIRSYQLGQRQNEEFRVKFAEVNRKISQYEQKIAQLTQQNQRLSASLNHLQQDLHASQARNHAQQKEIEQIREAVQRRENQRREGSGVKSQESTPAPPVVAFAKAESMIESNADYISSLIGQNKAFQDQIDGLIQDLNERKARISRLQEQNGELMIERVDLKGLINDYQRRIKQLSQQKSAHRSPQRSAVKAHQQQQEYSDNPYTMTGSEHENHLQKAYNELIAQHEALKGKHEELEMQKEVWNIKLYNLQEEHQRKLAEYEQRLSGQDVRQSGSSSSAEVVEIANRLSAKTAEYNKLLQQFRKLQEANASSEQEIKRLQQKQQQTTPGGFVSSHRRNNSQDGNLQIQLAQLNAAYTQLAIEKEELSRRVEETGHYYDKVLVFSEEIERLNANLRRKEGECKSLQAANQGHLQALASHQRTIDRLKEELEWFSRQSEPKNQQIYQLKQQAQGWEDRYWGECRQREAAQAQLQASRQGGQQLEEIADKQNLYHNEVERLNKIIKEQLGEIEVARMELGTLQGEQRTWTRDREQQEQVIQRLEDRLQQACAEVERLSQLVDEKSSALIALDVQSAQHRHQQENKIHELNRSLQEIRSAFQQLKREMVDVQSDSRLKQLKISSIGEYEVKIGELSREVDRLNELLIGLNINKQQQESQIHHQMTEIEALNQKLKTKDNEAVSTSQQASHLNGTIERLKAECQDQHMEKNTLKQRLKASDEITATHRQQLKEYSQKINQLHLQFETMQDMLRNTKHENTQQASTIDDLVAKNRFLAGQVDRLNSEVSVSSEETSQLRLSVSSDNALERRIQEHLSLFVVLFAEIESLRRTVQLRQDELTRLRAEAVSASRV